MPKRTMFNMLLLVLISGAIRAAEPFPADAAAAEIGQVLPSDFEASGITWHPGLQELFVVSDAGMVCAMRQTGQSARYWDVDRDLEAVAAASPQSDFIYLGVEHPDSICEFNIRTGKITRSFDLTDWMDGPKNSGLEALAFVPVAGDPEGGLFYAGLQDTGQIFVFRLPIVSSAGSTTVTYLRTLPAVDGVSEISDLCYVPSQHVLYAIYDSDDLLQVLETDGTLLGQWDLPGSGQEGIAVKGRQLYVSEDYGGEDGGSVFRYAPFTAVPEPDLNADGRVDLQDLSAMASLWMLETDRFSDIDVDGFVDLYDFAVLSRRWGAGL